MNEAKVTGIVLKAIDYKEKDKLITIFTVELGVISCVLKGVNNTNAKLKFAAMPFCFAEFVLAQKNGFFTVTECSQIESFYSIVSDYNKSLLGFFMLELTCIIMRQNEPDEQWFLILLNFLKELAFSEVNQILVACKFILVTLTRIGYGLNFNACNVCGLNFISDAFLNLNTGELVCETCFNSNSIKLTKQEFASLKIINNTELSKLKTIKINAEVLKSALLTLKNNLELRINHKIKSLFF